MSSRREFITLLGGAVAAWPLAARAQQPGEIRRIGVLMDLAADDPEGRARLAAFRAELSRLGWTDGRNIRIDIRWAAGVANRMREYAEELVALVPDAILASGSPSVGALQQSITKLPVVFTSVGRPGWRRLCRELARPGGNTTGFMLLEYSIGTKWLELLKDARAARDPGRSPPRSDTRLWKRPVRRDPGRGVIVRRGAEPDRDA